MTGGRHSSGNRRPRSAADEAAWRSRIEDARDRYKLSALIGRSVKLERAGREFRACCPFHGEKSPSFYVNDEKAFAHCFGCGWNGDAIDFVRQHDGLSFGEAVEYLAGEALSASTPRETRVDRRSGRDEAVQKIRLATSVWEETIPVPGTLGEAYLRSRAITNWPDTVRFAPSAFTWIDVETGEVGPRAPAIVAQIQGGDGVMTGVQRIFLSDDGLSKRFGKKSKKSLGRIAGGALRIGPASRTLFTTEGPEDGMSIAQEMGVPVWVSLGTANLPNIVYPDVVRRIVICAQNDDAGDFATDKAAHLLYRQGYEVDVRHPDPAYKDWNDQLMGKPR